MCFIRLCSHLSFNQPKSTSIVHKCKSVIIILSQFLPKPDLTAGLFNVQIVSSTAWHCRNAPAINRQQPADEDRTEMRKMVIMLLPSCPCEEHPIFIPGKIELATVSQCVKYSPQVLCCRSGRYWWFVTAAATTSNNAPDQRQFFVLLRQIIRILCFSTVSDNAPWRKDQTKNHIQKGRSWWSRGSKKRSFSKKRLSLYRGTSSRHSWVGILFRNLTMYKNNWKLLSVPLVTEEMRLCVSEATHQNQTSVSHLQSSIKILQPRQQKSSIGRR